MSRTTHCTNHCSACGTHFHSLSAFDAHRRGDHASNDPQLGRHCVHPLDDEKQRFTILGSGVCDIYPPEQHDVPIWTLRDSLENARRTWRPDRQAERKDAAA